MRQLDPADEQEVRRVALEYSNAFRSADAAAAAAMTVLPVVDCIDIGERSGVYLMDEEDFRHSVLEHANEDFKTEVTEVSTWPLGKNAAVVRLEATLTRADGATGETEWVTLLARTDEGWKVWANWLGPYPEGF